MKTNFLLVAGLTVAFSACTSSIPVVKTNNPDEYVVIGRNMAGPLSSLKLAQEEAELRAREHCEALGKTYKKNYALDKPMAVAQAPESTLYFTCVKN